MIVSEIEVSYNPIVRPKDRPKACSSKEAYDILAQNWQNIDLFETFKVLLLDQGNKVIGIRTVSTGGLSSTVVDARMIFSVALKCVAAAIVLAHNHPSGSVRPSQSDIDLTQSLRKSGVMLDILVQDHLILTPDGYYSFADEGIHI